MSFISGPWESEGPDRVVKRMPAGQIIRAVRPPQSGAQALVASDVLTICRSSTSLPPDKNCVVGTLTRLLLEKSTGMLIVTVVAGRDTFTTRIARDRIEADGLIPGRLAAVTFSPDAVKWLSSENSTQDG